MNKALLSLALMSIFFIVGNLHAETKADKKLASKKSTTETTQGWKEPTDFRGVPWGAPSKVLKEKFNDAYCREHEPDVSGDTFCRSEFYIGQVSVKGYFNFRNGLVRISLIFNSEEFDKMMSIFSEKYGPATSKKQNEITTRGGLKYTDERHIWKGSTVEITAEKYHDTISESQIIFWLVADQAAAVEMMNKRNKRAADDL